MRKSLTPDDADLNRYLPYAIEMITEFLSSRGFQKQVKTNELIKRYARYNKLKIVGKYKDWITKYYLKKKGIDLLSKPYTSKRLKPIFREFKTSTAYNYHIENVANPTKAESRFKALIDYLQIQYVIEYPVKKIKSFYLIDFYLPRYGVAVEIDGEYHQTSSQVLKDKIRDAFLNSKGIKVIRISNSEMMSITNATDLLKRLLLS